MPSFDLINNVELFVRKGKFPVDASKSSKTVIRAASKHFIYKDGCLWRTYRGRLLKVVRSDEEVREILTRYHDDNNHAGRDRTVREIMLMYYWVGVTEAVKTWVRACPACQSRNPTEPPNPPVQFCLAYGCDASSYVDADLSFFRFPKEAEQRQRWLMVAQRDEGSLRSNSYLCSRHFESSCFTLSAEGQLTLSPDAVPTIITVTAEEDEVPVPSDEDFLCSNSLEDLLSSAAAAADTTDPSAPGCNRSVIPVQLQEHQYCLPAPAADPREFQPVREEQRRKTVLEPSFSTYNQIARYLSHRVLPMQSKKSRVALKRMAKRFGLTDGVLMFTRVSPPLRVPRSREEVNAILQQFHDNQGHYGQGICQQEITKHFYWSSMTRDLASWISSCHTCLNRTKRKWLRCSIHSCNHCCGPVERGLGLAFHKFPLHNPPLLAQWLKAVGRANWHPRLGSSICSTHFTEDCFDRTGEKVTLRPDAVPTRLVHNSSAPLFAKYDAVELYLRQRIYPHGLSYVEKNTFRRFCKKFVIKGDELHMVKGDRVRLVLRSRQQVEVALKDYHNELNHLDTNKCLRLLNERFFWKTMRPDVVQWISSCSECNRQTRKKPENQAAAGGSESSLQTHTSPQIHRDVSSETDDAEEEEEDDDGGGGGSVGDEEMQEPDNREDEPPRPAAPINPQRRIPIILQPGTRVRSVQRGKRSQADVQKETNGADTHPEGQSGVQDHPEEQMGPGVVARDSRGSARTHHYVRELPPPDVPAKPQLPQATTNEIQPVSPDSQSQTATETQNDGGVQRPPKRSRDLEADSSASRTSSCGLEPVVAPSTKPWPVFTIAGSAPVHAAKPAEADRSSPALCRGPRTLQARTVIQQCSRAKVKIKPALDGAEAQWAEIQEGMVVYVCFSRGATENVTYEIANTLMTTKLFRKDTRHWVSVVDLPGSVLFIPQDSLLGEPVPKRKMQFKGGCEPWWGAQLFSNLVFTCRELVQRSVKCTKAGVKVEQGVYGQKQEMVLNCAEPLTVLLEF
ncbi:uncharacterized protein LOC118116161 [Hippoglossus stenolepis]|uniref:uncharacterized protein LOC118116161 n=1 Tax=Hippoglossus stenolepis TaxID=195615 RepID=UPI001FAF0784|nr:uncharacterized protein LOC118116161 [Hippoglossus stenolepis]